MAPSTGPTVVRMAHDLANALASVTARLSVLANQDLPQAILAELRTTLSEIGSAREAVRDILQAAQPDARERLSLAEAWQRAVASACLEIAGVRVEMESTAVEVFANPAQLEQLLASVLAAEIAAAGRDDGAKVQARIAIAGARAELVVTGGWPPFAAQELQKLSNPFFVRNPEEWGGGVGFGICTKIARAHGGGFSLDNHEGMRRYRLDLPALAPRPVALPAPVSSANGGSILVVDDDARVRDSYALMFHHLGYEVEAVASGEEALERVAAAAYRAVILDLHLGQKLDGTDVLAEQRRSRPEVLPRTILATGDPSSATVRRLVEELGLRVLAKPFGVGELRDAVESLG